MYGYIYLTTCTVNNKKYIGSHKYDKEELDPRYIGSGKTFSKAVRKYGKNNFICEVLEYCETKDDLVVKEQYYISLYDAVSSDEYYNIDSGRGNSHTYITDEITKIRLSEAQKKHITVNNGVESHVIDKSNLNEYLNNGYIIGRLPIDYSERTKKFKSTHYSKDYEEKRLKWVENIRKSVSGRRWITNGLEDKQIPFEDTLEYIKNGWRYGRVTARGKN